MGNKIMNRIFILALCLFCFTVYFNSFNNNFVLDDEALVVNNSLIKSSKLLMQIFKTSPYDYKILDREISYDRMYRPLQLLSYSVDYKIWRLNPLGFHLTNIIIHLLNSILIYYLFSTISNNTFAKIVSIVFAVHPINTSVVTYISGRADLLVCFFILLSVFLFFKFIKFKLKVYYVISLSAAVLALFCRENALILFLFILLVLVISKVKPKYFLYVIPFILLDLLYLILRFIIFGQYAITLHPAFVSLPLRIVNFLNIIPRYLFILALPLDLHLLRTTPFIRQLIDPRTFLGIGFILFYIYLMVRLQKNRLLLFSMFWFLIGLTPVFFYLDGYALLDEAMMAESWVYLSSIGFFTLFVFVQNIFNRLGKILVISIIIFYGFLTWVNNNYWKNSIIFYKNILEHTSERNPLRKELIKEYLRHKLYEDALVEIKKLSIYYPESEDLYLFQGNYYYLINEISTAIDNYNRALRKNKNNFYIYYNLSLCYEKLKQLDRAIDYASESIKINPYYLSALIQLGDLYSEKKEFIKAGQYYQMALELDPDNQLLKDKVKNAK